MRLSPMGLIRFGPLVANMPLDRCWLRSRNGTCLSGGSLPGWASLCSQVISQA
jgi:hypothetical protein